MKPFAPNSMRRSRYPRSEDSHGRECRAIRCNARTKLSALRFAALLVWLLTVADAVAAVRYVNLNNPTPTPPYTNWSTAATTIQDAVDAANAGDEIVVTNGVYQTGGRAVYGTMTNRVAVTKPVTVRSVNGPELTVVLGYSAPWNLEFSNIRCVYLTNGAALAGFTLTNGAARAGGGVWCESDSAVVSNCTLIGNSSEGCSGDGCGGGGAYGGTLNNCTLADNSADWHGGGASWSTLNNCTLTRNWGVFGGGASESRLSNCLLAFNSALSAGGGAASSTLKNCTLTSNSVIGFFGGGGAYRCTLVNCRLFGNSGGGAAASTLTNCTLLANSTEDRGGGARYCTLNNCIVYYNTTLSGDESNYADSTLSYSCSTPLASGVGNIADEPQLASATYLSAGSPCRGAGSAADASGLDIDGEPWANPPSMGCDEVHLGAAIGTLLVSIEATYTNVAKGFEVGFRAHIDGRVSASRWEYGDGTTASNRLFASHAWTAAGDFPVVLRAYNDSNPGGVTATVIVRVVEGVYYVAADTSGPMPPYNSWATAARTIQEAVGAATVPGAVVIVTNGTYAPVSLNENLTLRSVNGPALSRIDGGGVSRCVNLASNAIICGFTLTHGAFGFGSGDGGAVYCLSSSAVVSNCVLIGNSANSGGGAFGGTLIDCTITGNQAAGRGGGAAWSTLRNCTLIGNSSGAGGGAYGGTLDNCTLKDNYAVWGGGASTECRLNNCTLANNVAGTGGGAFGACALNNCVITGNRAQGGRAVSSEGGGTFGCSLTNCTVTGNSAGSGGGTYGGILNNCIVYYNSSGTGLEANYRDSIVNYSCTTPLPPDGVGNIADEPELAYAGHLTAGSPCRGAGNAAYAIGVDIDGEPWANPPSMGSDEYHPSVLTGPLSVSFDANYTNVATGFTVEFRAQLDGRFSASRWEFGDGMVVSNRTFVISHAWANAGVYLVVLRAYNADYPEGVAATLTMHVTENPMYYVALDSANPLPPYSSWATAARDIQAAMDAAIIGGTVLVSNGVYETGGRVGGLGATNRVAVTKPVAVRSVNGPDATVITGGGSMRCVYLTNGPAIVGFTLTGGVADLGGGVFCESHSAAVSNCKIIGNSAGGGGGAWGGTLNNCVIAGNSASNGGGAYGCTLNNCTITGNSAQRSGGGAWWGTLNNCIVYFNNAPFWDQGPDHDGGSTLNFCLTTRASGNNIDLDPLFVDAAGGDLRVQSNSPCINAGRNAYAPQGQDLDGLPRISGGTVDIGAYEFQNPSSALSYAWLQQFSLPTDGSADLADPDGDLVNNDQEWRAGTDPTDASSILRLFPPSFDGANWLLSWPTVPGRAYTLERSTNLNATPRFTAVATNVAGQPGVTSVMGPHSPAPGSVFFRVRVEE